MRLLKDRCPECQGRLKVIGSEVVCLSCPFRSQIKPGKAAQELLEKNLVEINETFRLTDAGEFILSLTKEGDLFGSLTTLVRLLKTYEEGYELRDKDKVFLRDSGFLREEVKNGHVT